MAGWVSLSWMAVLSGREAMSPNALIWRRQILQRGGDEEILLAQSQFLAGRRGVRWVENFGNRFRADLFGERAGVVAVVECFQSQWVNRARRPQAQRVDAAATPADHGGVVCDRLDGFGRTPDVARGFRRGWHRLDRTAEADVVMHLGAFEFPRVAERQPVIREFELPAVLDDLLEHAVVVTDAVAVRGNAERRHALDEAGGEPAEAAVAEAGVGLERAQAVEIDVQFGERIAHGFGDAEVVEVVEQQAADEEFERQVVDAFFALLVGGIDAGEPAIYCQVAHCHCRGDEPVPVGGDGAAFADVAFELGQDGGTQRGHLVGAVRRGGSAAGRIVRHGNRVEQEMHLVSPSVHPFRGVAAGLAFSVCGPQSGRGIRG